MSPLQINVALHKQIQLRDYLQTQIPSPNQDTSTGTTIIP